MITLMRKHALTQDILNTDFVTYPFGIFSSTIISKLSPSSSLVQDIGYGTVVNCFYLPGCIVGGLLMDAIGRKQTMTLGFACWAGKPCCLNV